MTRTSNHALLLIGHGSQDPAATAITWATTDGQQAVPATLGTLPEVITASKLPAPAVIVIGDEAARSDILAWFEPNGKTPGFINIGPPLLTSKKEP